ncbi:hypothetical protein [Aurantibacter sp.]|uniref:hypothetical protein n=1 Tax=Aurantibacter sp. TaxID=2807103 RepID=UPI0032633485
MKKLIFTAVFALGSFATFAQEAATETQEAATEVVAQDSFSEISVEEVPQAVSDMIEASYPGATINKAEKNAENHYKLEVALEDGTVGSLTLDEEGKTLEQ